MAIRTDIFSVDWSVSPRLIWIDISVTEVSAQDLYDTCKHLEFLPSGMDEPVLCDAGGWEPLGQSVFVGITVSLFNAQYAFANRPGPTWIICNMAGGNVVGFTGPDRLVEQYPRYPTSYVSADRTASSAATTKEQNAIEYGSFGGGVTVDTSSVYSGTTFPTGTPQQPVNNMTDALNIAIERGLTSFFIIDDITLDDSLDFEEYSFYGASIDKTLITIGSDAIVTKCEFYEASIQGTLDGQTKIRNCLVKDINYVSGYVEECVLDGTVTLGGDSDAYFLDCWAGTKRDNPPTVDMGGTGQTLVLQNFNGSIKIKNKSGINDECNVSLNAGMVILESTVTAGGVNIMGTGAVFDYSNGADVDTTYLVSPGSVTEAVWSYER